MESYVQYKIIMDFLNTLMYFQKKSKVLNFETKDNIINGKVPKIFFVV